jgi:hypothetical protein
LAEGEAQVLKEAPHKELPPGVDVLLDERESGPDSFLKSMPIVDFFVGCERKSMGLELNSE